MGLFGARDIVPPPVTPLVWHFATKCAAVKLAEPWMLKHFSELRDHNYVSSVMYPECPTKDWWGKPCWSTRKRARRRPRPRWSNCISDLAWSSLGVEPAELSEIAVDCDVFRVLLVLLPPRPSREEKRAWKWTKFWLHSLLKSITFTVFSLLTGCLSAQLTCEQIP